MSQQTADNATMERKESNTGYDQFFIGDKNKVHLAILRNNFALKTKCNHQGRGHIAKIMLLGND